MRRCGTSRCAGSSARATGSRSSSSTARGGPSRRGCSCCRSPPAGGRAPSRRRCSCRCPRRCASAPSPLCARTWASCARARPTASAGCTAAGATPAAAAAGEGGAGLSGSPRAAPCTRGVCATFPSPQARAGRRLREARPAGARLPLERQPAAAEPGGAQLLAAPARQVPRLLRRARDDAAAARAHHLPRSPRGRGGRRRVNFPVRCRNARVARAVACWRQDMKSPKSAKIPRPQPQPTKVKRLRCVAPRCTPGPDRL